eukprot:PhM_4_TR2991/c0_g2_i1/m.14356
MPFGSKSADMANTKSYGHRTRHFFSENEQQQQKCLLELPECSVFVTHRASIRMADFMLKKCCAEHQALKNALQSFLKIANRAGVMDVWATAGTLLGLLRNKGTIIPWDTDIDILIWPHDEKRLRRALEAADVVAHHKTMFLEKEHGHGRLFAFFYDTPTVIHEDAPHVEVWVAQEHKKMQRRNVTVPLRNCRMYGGAVSGLKCPARSLDVLRAGYGENWQTPCKSRSSNCKT